MKISALILIICTYLFLYPNAMRKEISKNGMTVRWEHQDNQIHIEMEAPTKGWIAIGYNKSEELKDTYLIMGNVQNGNVNVMEHYVIQAGNYQSFEKLGELSNIEKIMGWEKDGKTFVSFNISIQKFSKYTKVLSKDKTYNLFMAYSQEDDFQHHSIMRTSVLVVL